MSEQSAKEMVVRLKLILEWMADKGPTKTNDIKTELVNMGENPMTVQSTMKHLSDLTLMPWAFRRGSRKMKTVAEQVHMDTAGVFYRWGQKTTGYYVYDTGAVLSSTGKLSNNTFSAFINGRNIPSADTQSMTIDPARMGRAAVAVEPVLHLQTRGEPVLPFEEAPTGHGKSMVPATKILSDTEGILVVRHGDRIIVAKIISESTD